MRSHRRAKINCVTRTVFLNRAEVNSFGCVFEKSAIGILKGPHSGECVPGRNDGPLGVGYDYVLKGINILDPLKSMTQAVLGHSQQGYLKKFNSVDCVIKVMIDQVGP